MNTRSFDLIVIGSGPAAGTVAKKTAEAGKSVAVVESRGFGGTCALRGCNPKEVYANAGDLFDRATHAKGKLIEYDGLRIDWANLHTFKEEFTQPVRDKSEASFQELGIETVNGAARFIGPTTIQVDGQSLHGERVFVGVGATPAKLNIDGEEFVTLSDEFFELKELPKHITFIGGGYVSMEFAHVAARYGCNVLVIDHHERPLNGFDPDLVDQLTAWSAKLGIEFALKSRATKITKWSAPDSQYRVQLKTDHGERFIQTNLVVHGAGRVPHLSELNLDAAEVRHGEDGIAVDQWMRSVTNPKVFVAGDCADTGMPRLTPVANEEARIVVKNLFADSLEIKPDYGIVPSVVFTSPRLAAIGKSESEAREMHSDPTVLYQDTSTWGTVRKSCQPCAAYKLLIDPKTDRILGAHLLGPAAEEIINLFALAMKFNLTATDMKSTLFAYPTFGADVRRML